MLKEKAIYTVAYYDFSEHIAETYLFSSKTKAKEAVSKIINGYDEVHNSDDNDTSYFWYEHITQNDWKFENEDSYGWISIRKNKALVDEDNSVYVLMTILIFNFTCTKRDCVEYGKEQTNGKIIHT